MWRGFFWFAAIYNLAIGGAMGAAPGRVAGQLGVEGPGAPYAVAMVGLLIAVFGVGYAITAHAPERNRGIVWIGLLSKLGAVALGGIQYAAGAIGSGALALSIGDLAFAGLFVVFLLRGSQPGPARLPNA